MHILIKSMSNNNYITNLICRITNIQGFKCISSLKNN